MAMLDELYDGGEDGFDDGFGHNEVDHSDSDFGDDGYGFDYPQQEEYENDADNFESHQCALDNDKDFGDGNY